MNGLRTAQELAENKPHGTRIKYMAGCRCVPCRAANSTYESSRLRARKNGEWNGLVDAAPVRKHLRKLSKAGIGRDTVSDITGIGVTTIDELRTGKQKNIRSLNAKKILNVGFDAMPESALVSIKETRKNVNELKKEGFTERSLAERLGYKSNSLQLKSKITAKKALRIKRFYNQLMAE